MAIRLATWVVAAAMLALPRASYAACDVQPPHRNPKDIPGITMSEWAEAANLVISEDHDRVYDLVDTVDGVTIGFGNWPQQQLRDFFKDMATADHGAAFAALTECLAKYFGEPNHRGEWRALAGKAGLGDTEPTQQSSDAALQATLMSETWMSRYGTHCKVNCQQGQANFYREQQAWFLGVMRYALADRRVIQWQMDFWTRTVVADGVRMAAEAGMGEDEAAIVGFVAYASSSPGWANDVISAARSGGKLTFGSHVWNWNAPPNKAPADKAGLESWHRVVIWQYYVEHTRREQLRRRSSWNFRGRSIAYYKRYLRDRWVLPVPPKSGTASIPNDVRNLDPSLLKPRA